METRARRNRVVCFSNLAGVSHDSPKGPLHVLGFMIAHFDPSSLLVALSQLSRNRAISKQQSWLNTAPNSGLKM
jgi:hypothetical protein